MAQGAWARVPGAHADRVQFRQLSQHLILHTGVQPLLGHAVGFSPFPSAAVRLISQKAYSSTRGFCLYALHVDSWLMFPAPMTPILMRLHAPHILSFPEIVSLSHIAWSWPRRKSGGQARCPSPAPRPTSRSMVRKAGDTRSRRSACEIAGEIHLAFAQRQLNEGLPFLNNSLDDAVDNFGTVIAAACGRPWRGCGRCNRLQGMHRLDRIVAGAPSQSLPGSRFTATPCGVEGIQENPESIAAGSGPVSMAKWASMESA